MLWISREIDFDAIEARLWSTLKDADALPDALEIEMLPHHDFHHVVRQLKALALRVGSCPANGPGVS